MRNLAQQGCEGAHRHFWGVGEFRAAADLLGILLTSGMATVKGCIASLVQHVPMTR